MGGLWGNSYIRLAMTAIFICAVCYVTILCGNLIATAVVIKANFGLMVKFNQDVPALYFRPAMLLGVLPIVPFWLLAENSYWHKGKPLPLGSYLLFIILFFFCFYTSALIDISQNKDNAMMGVLVWVGCYIGSALLAAAVGWFYYFIWYRRQINLPTTQPDVF